jgi:hypothetical protein
MTVAVAASDSTAPRHGAAFVAAAGSSASAASAPVAPRPSIAAASSRIALARAVAALAAASRSPWNAGRERALEPSRGAAQRQRRGIVVGRDLEALPERREVGFDRQRRARLIAQRRVAALGLRAQREHAIVGVAQRPREGVRRLRDRCGERVRHRCGRWRRAAGARGDVAR